METNKICVLLKENVEVQLTSNTPDMQTLIDKIVEHKDEIDYTKVSVKVHEQNTTFDKVGFENLVKELIKDFLDKLKIQDSEFTKSIEHLKSVN